MEDMSRLKFTEREYDGTGAARFSASRPDGWTYQTDQYGRELWLVSSDGLNYDRIHGDWFFVETLADFKEELSKVLEPGRRNLVEAKKLRDVKKQKIDEDKVDWGAIWRGVRALCQICILLGNVAWTILMALVIIAGIVLSFMMLSGGIVALIPLWGIFVVIRGLNSVRRS